VILLRGGLPGDSVEVQIESNKPSLALGRVLRVVEPSPHRAPSACSYVEQCGGCPLLPLDSKPELDVKLSIVDQALVRTGKLTTAELASRGELQSAGERLGYRTRMRFQQRAGQIGFFGRESHLLVDVEKCQVASPELGELLREVRAELQLFPELMRDVEGVELAVFPENPREPEAPRERSSLVFYWAQQVKAAGTERERFSALARLGAVRTLTKDELRTARPFGKSAQRYWILPDLYIRVAPGSFSQVNPGVNRLLIRTVLASAAEVDARTFLDLYGGAGNFTLPLLRQGLRGTLVEFNGASVEWARVAADEQGLSGAQFFVGDVAAWVRAQGRQNKGADLVVLDPPRAGAKDALVDAYRLADKRLLLVGCDPTAFARDLRQLLDLGGTLRSIVPLDMFPGTHHIELIALIDKPHRASGG